VSQVTFLKKKKHSSYPCKPQTQPVFGAYFLLVAMPTRFFVGLFVGVFLLSRCGSERADKGPPEPTPSAQDGAALARIHCSACHEYTAPDLLPRAIWLRKVLPNMATRLGLPMGFPYQKLSPDDMQAVMAAHVIPDHPVLHGDDMRKIVEYYAAHAPDTLPAPVRSVPLAVGQLPFRVRSRATPPVSTQNTLLRAFPERAAVLLSFEDKGTFWFDLKKKTYQTVAADIVASDAVTWDSTLYLLHIGQTEAYNLARGRLWAVPLRGGASATPQPVLDSLIRPVSVDVADLNADRRPDFVVCEFGDYLGRLTLYLSQSDGRYRRQVLRNYPGACKAIFEDLNADGRLDIAVLMSQGREELCVFLNENGTQFGEKSIARFPPSYGCNALAVTDVDRDGRPDLLITNGDNADISSALKPYHGLRVYRNEGGGQFAPPWFYPMHGASGLTAADFDGDEEVDIAVIAHFPDFGATQPEDFIFFKKKPNALDFEPRRWPTALNGRLLTIDHADLDGDGDQDLLIGNYLDQLTPVGPRYADWQRQPTDWWWLENTR
jgi:hypothetical protein